MNYRGVISNDTEEWWKIWVEIDLSFQNCHKEFDEFWPEHLVENLHFNGLLLNKVYNVWAKKSIGEFCLMALNIDATFEGKLTCAFKNDMRNLANFHQNTWKCQNWYFHGILLSKVENAWAATYREVTSNDTGEWWTIWRGIDLSFQNWHKKFGKFWLEILKVLKIRTLMDCFWPKHIMFELKKYRGDMFDDSEY